MERSDRVGGVLWLKSLAVVVVVPGVVAGLGPWVVTARTGRGDPGALATVGGWLLVAAGSTVLLSSVWRFATEGRGTLAPVAPTEHLVVGGMYRWVRNPMYVAVGAVLVGWALVAGSWWLVVYLACFVAAVSAFVHLYEEPVLTARYGDEYRRYRDEVPAWWPRRTPWQP